MKTHLSWALLSLFISSTAFAGTIAKVVDSKVYIVFDAEDSFAEGDLFVAVNAAGKKTGLILIEKVRGVKAIGLLQKGKALAGSTTEFKAVAKSTKSKLAKKYNDDLDQDSAKNKKSNRSRWGVLAGYGIASQTVTNPVDGKGYDLTGSSLSLKGLYDHPIFETVALRLLGGGEIFSVSGTGPVANTEFGTDVKYLTADLLMKWNFLNSTSWCGYFIGGMGVYYPLSKSSTAIDSDTLTSFVIGEFGGGFEMKFGSYSIPLEASYYYYPSGETVKTSVISIKTGVIF